MQEGTVLYKHFDADGRSIYYGISDANRERQKTHRYGSAWAQFSARYVEEVYASRALAEAAERAAIAADEPVFNRAHNTEGWQHRVVQYLVEKERYDLLDRGACCLDVAGMRVLAQIRARPVLDDGSGRRWYLSGSGPGMLLTDDQAFVHLAERRLPWCPHYDVLKRARAAHH
jgi:hypothetical protein